MDAATAQTQAALATLPMCIVKSCSFLLLNEETVLKLNSKNQHYRPSLPAIADSTYRVFAPTTSSSPAYRVPFFCCATRLSKLVECAPEHEQANLQTDHPILMYSCYVHG